MEQVDDATEPCPACGAVRWGRVAQSGGGVTAVCRNCGHEEHLGTFYGPGASEPLDAEAVARLRAVRGARPEVRSARFPVYGIDAVPATVAGYGTRDGAVVLVTLACGSFTVESEARGDPRLAEQLARRALEHVIANAAAPAQWPGGSDVAIGLWLNARQRDHEARAAAAPLVQQQLVVDGEPTRFATVAADGWFAAAGERDGVGITVSGPDSSVLPRLRAIAPGQATAGA